MCHLCRIRVVRQQENMPPSLLVTIPLIMLFIGVSWWRSRWTPYDPSWLIALVKDQRPKDFELQQALCICTKARDRGTYVYFVSNKNPNQPGSEWQFKRNVLLEHSDYFVLAIDVLSGGRVGGVELLPNNSLQARRP